MGFLESRMPQISVFGYIIVYRIIAYLIHDTHHEGCGKTLSLSHLFLIYSIKQSCQINQKYEELQYFIVSFFIFFPPLG
jgi:hypothetical protein